MNILHINTLDSIGGAAKVAYRLKDNLKERGHQEIEITFIKRNDKNSMKEIDLLEKS